MDKEYRFYTAETLGDVPQLGKLPPSYLRDMRTVAKVLPFKTNNYVIDELIDWANIPDDPIFTMTFPRRDLLSPEHFSRAREAIDSGTDVREEIRTIQRELNPDPARQSSNVPVFRGERLAGIQHKYRETVLFFPAHGQTCHAYCTFCFRWPQFGGLGHDRFASADTAPLLDYLAAHPDVTDLLITGGDPLAMPADMLANYLEPILKRRDNGIRTIRIGTKAISYWPYRFLSDPDSERLVRLLERIVETGTNLSVMAHFNHPVELSTPAAEAAILRLRSLGAQIRTQAPILRHINDRPEVWAELWRRQVDIGCIPYYMFVERNTGAKHFYSLSLERCWEVFSQAYRQVSGICRTVRGPIMSSSPGKVQVLGTAVAAGEKVFVLRFIQGRNPEWAARPFFAAYDSGATWLDGLKPAFGEKEFFFASELAEMYAQSAMAFGENHSELVRALIEVLPPPSE